MLVGYNHHCLKSVQIWCFFWSAFSRVFSPNTGKYGPEKILYLDTFHAVHVKNHFIKSYSITKRLITCCPLIVVKLLVTPWKNNSLFVAQPHIRYLLLDVKWDIICYKIHSFFVAKISPYSLKKSILICYKNHSTKISCNILITTNVTNAFVQVDKNTSIKYKYVTIKA